MNIGDKVIPVDIAGTSSLDRNKEYVVVDINEYGNIGLKDPAAGCLLEHYYKPERLSIAPTKPLISLGDILELKEESSIYKGEKFLVTYLEGKYWLVGFDGKSHWGNPEEDIDDLIEGWHFKKLHNPHKNNIKV